MIAPHGSSSRYFDHRCRCDSCREAARGTYRLANDNTRPTQGRVLVEPGEQPERDGYLQCLECGAWAVHLYAHLGRVHGLERSAYQQRHGLPQNSPVVSSDQRRRNGARYRDALDAKARAAGYQDFRDLIQRTRNEGPFCLAGRVGINYRTIIKYRKRDE